MAGTGSSMLYSFLLFTVILSLQEVYRGKLASSEWFTILGGFTSSLLFLVSLTFIGNFQESSGMRTGWGAVIIAEAIALIAASTVHRLPVLCWTTVRGQQDIRFDAFKKRIQIKASLNLRLRYGLCQSVAGRERLVLFHVVHDSSKRASCGHNGNNEADAAQYLQAKPVGAPLRDLRNGHFYGEVHSQQPKP